MGVGPRTTLYLVGWYADWLAREGRRPTVQARRDAATLRRLTVLADSDPEQPLGEALRLAEEMGEPDPT